MQEEPRVRDDGWIKAGDVEMKSTSFLGASLYLFRAIPKLWLEPLSVVEQARLIFSTERLVNEVALFAKYVLMRHGARWKSSQRATNTRTQ